MESIQHHVRFNRKSGRWEVKRSNAHRISRNFTTQAEAVAYARIVSLSQKTELVVFRLDGNIDDMMDHTLPSS